MVFLVDGQTTTRVCDSSHRCLNGGICEKSLGFSGESVQICNCENAVDKYGNDYIGIYCEQEVKKPDGLDDGDSDNAPTSKCDNGSTCFNSGLCVDNKCVCHDGSKG